MLLGCGSETVTVTRAFWAPALPSRTAAPPIENVAAGTQRSSSVSTERRPGEGRRRPARRRAFWIAVRERADFSELNRLRNHMRFSFVTAVCDTMGGHRSRRANRAPGRCRAGEGLAWR